VIARRVGIFWTGLAIYAGSFFLAAVAFSTVGSRPLRGYWCAVEALRLPFQAALFETQHFERFSLLISGLVNVTFLLFVVLVLGNRGRLLTAGLRIMVPVMIPFCWVVFYYERVYPREGHFLWILGMLFVLLSAEPPAHPAV
jgi:hypothetical protein